MPFAEVSVNSPVAQRKTFSYGVPSGLNLKIGQAVWVPFGAKTLQGIVMELTEHPSVEQTKEISGIIDSQPLLSPVHISLAKWISTYYFAPLFQSVALMLPPGFGRRVITFLEKPPKTPEMPACEDLDCKDILALIYQKGKVSQTELDKNFGKRLAAKSISQLIRQEVVTRTYELEKPRVKPRFIKYYTLAISDNEVALLRDLQLKRAPKQAALLEIFVRKKLPVAEYDLDKEEAYSPLALRALVEKGIIKVEEVRFERDPLSGTVANLSLPLPLTATQESVYKAISEGLNKDAGYGKAGKVFLLRGVTGSGKTEIYLQSLAEAVRQGKKGIVLVPEIAMTPQITERFVSRFPGRVAILHSDLSLGEQFDEWWRIKNGEFDVVIGPRSALFAPQPDLGLIIIDEEHEWTYKQADISPRYHARETAVKLASLSGAVLVLGSATPDVESYYKGLNGYYNLLEMPERVTPDEGSPLPRVEIVDLREELKAGNLSLFSRSLFRSMEEALKNHEQIILFLNRRGSASFIECRVCGWVFRCKRCDVPLSYHFNEQVLICHQCNNRKKVLRVCPNCGSLKIKYLGAGTEKLEQETLKAFPHSRVIRWDSDAIKRNPGSHQKIFDKFRAGEADILIGTQMVAKGLDLPGVTLVGVISADIALNLPDFRAGERAFQLLSQVSGRSGRGSAGGKVVIQTYSPVHYAIQAAAHHDYRAFFDREIAYRREMQNPPFTRLTRLVFSHTNEVRCQEETERIKRKIIQERDAKGIAGVSLIGPAPAYIHKLRRKYRWQLLLRASNPLLLISEIPFPRGWTVDIDPVGM